MKKLSFVCVLSLLASLIVGVLVPLSAMAAEPTGPTGPERGFVLSTTYPSIVAGKGQSIDFPIDVVGKGRADERLDLSILSAPQGWETNLKDRGYGIRSLFVLAGKTQSFSLQVKPVEDVAPGNYKVVLQGLSTDGAVKSTLELSVGIENKPVGGLKLNTNYPMLQGPSTSKFSFKVDLVNDGDEERTIGVTANQPQDWQVTVKPSYEDKQISSVKVKSGSTQGLDIDVTPAPRASPGEYPVDVQATWGNTKANLNLKLVLKGTYELSMGTVTGRLNANATAGQPTNISVVVNNKGSADLRNVSFITSKPDGWEVTFNPDKIDTLAAGGSREVNVSIKPSGKAIAGDYVVSLTASTPGASETAQLRVTVETPTVWGWAGIILVLIVVGGLGGLFTRLGRR